MSIFKKIKNITNNTISIGDFFLNANTAINFPKELKKRENFIFLFDKFQLNEIELYDNDNNLLNGQTFYNIWYQLYPIYKNNFSETSYKIFEFLNIDILLNNLNINYDIVPKSIDCLKDLNITLQPKETYTQGLLTNIEYFEINENGTNFINPILNVNIKYNVNDKGLVFSKETKTTWMLQNETYSTEYTLKKVYLNDLEKRNEASKMKNVILDNLISETLNIVYDSIQSTSSYNDAELLVLPFFDSLESEISKYLRGNIQPLILGIVNANTTTYNWLNINVAINTTLQDYMENKILDAMLTQGVYSSPEPI